MLHISCTVTLEILDDIELNGMGHDTFSMTLLRQYLLSITKMITLICPGVANTCITNAKIIFLLVFRYNRNYFVFTD